MVFRIARCALLASAVILGVRVPAQQPAPPPPAAEARPAAPTGSVTGTVVAQDTQKPVRFAQVELQSVESVANATGNGRGAAGGNFGGGIGGMVQARTEVDGTFTATNVVPGDYYVTASALGYIPERSLLLAAVNDGHDPGQLLAGLPVVHVAADSTSSVNLGLQRGGTLSGRVVWEDGSAAAAVTVNAVQTPQLTTQLPAPLQGLQLNGFGALTATDDRGDFRISGLPSGDYLLQAVIQNRVQFGGPGGPGGGGRGQAAPSTIRVYAPGVFRKSAGKAYSVRAGDERSDVRLVVDLRSLRTVSGHAASVSSGQNVASGRVSLVDSSDSSLQLQGIIDAEGNFTVRYVPPGNYTLQISGASTQVNSGFRGRGGGDTASTTPAVSFQPFSQAIVVTDADLSGFAATLTPLQTASQ